MGHYVLRFHQMIKETNFVKDYCWNVHQNIHSPTVEARAALQNSAYSKESTCLTLNTVTLSLFTSSVYKPLKMLFLQRLQQD